MDIYCQISIKRSALVRQNIFLNKNIRFETSARGAGRAPDAVVHQNFMIPAHRNSPLLFLKSLDRYTTSLHKNITTE